MQLRRIELTNFRNISHAQLEFDSRRVFFVGENGQGKTNLLEAISLARGVGSFRTHRREPMVRNGTSEAIVRQEWEHERLGEIAIGASLTAQKQKLTLGNEPLRSVSKIIGEFPVVSMSLADRALIYGGPEARREEIDSLIAQMDPSYARICAAYDKALRSRNALLGNPQTSPEVFRGFEEAMLAPALRIIRSRQRLVELIAGLSEQALGEFAPSHEKVRITYRPHTPPDALAREWEARRTTKDAAVGYTTAGPHRDDFELALGEENIGLYGSEGQKFSVVLALKIAGLRLLAEKLSVAPVLVCDDLLLELDAGRQKRFWAGLGDYQVFASSTTPPIGGENWQTYAVSNGTFSLERK